MSSHHIVRDQQEPALFIDKFEYFSVEILHSLLEWSPTVICCESSVDLYTKQGLKLDVGLVGHLNYEYWKRQLKSQYPLKLIAIHGSDFLYSGLTFLQKSNHRAVNIITDEGSLPEIIKPCLQYVPYMDIVILTEIYRHVLPKSLVYKKWLPAFSDINVTPLTNGSHITTGGFEENIDNEWLQERRKLTKKEEGEIFIKSSQAFFMISEGI